MLLVDGTIVLAACRRDPEVAHQDRPDAPRAGGVEIRFHGDGDMVELLSMLVGVGRGLHYMSTHADAPVMDGILMGAFWGCATYIGGQVIAGAAERRRRETRPRVFISYHHGQDQAMKDLLSHLGESGSGGFAFDDVSVRRRYRGRQPARIRAALTRRVRSADVVVVVAGEQTHERAYVNHEVDVALEDGKGLVVMKLKRGNPAPPQLYGAGVHWAAPNAESFGRALVAAARGE